MSDWECGGRSRVAANAGLLFLKPTCTERTLTGHCSETLPVPACGAYNPPITCGIQITKTSFCHVPRNALLYYSKSTPRWHYQQSTAVSCTMYRNRRSSLKSHLSRMLD